MTRKHCLKELDYELVNDLGALFYTSCIMNFTRPNSGVEPLGMNSDFSRPETSAWCLSWRDSSWLSCIVALLSSKMSMGTVFTKEAHSISPRLLKPASHSVSRSSVGAPVTFASQSIHHTVFTRSHYSGAHNSTQLTNSTILLRAVQQN